MKENYNHLPPGLGLNPGHTLLVHAARDRQGVQSPGSKFTSAAYWMKYKWLQKVLLVPMLVLLFNIIAFGQEMIVNGSMTGTPSVLSEVATGKLPSGWTIWSGTPDTHSPTAAPFGGAGGISWIGTPVASPNGGTFAVTVSHAPNSSAGFGNEGMYQDVNGLVVGQQYTFSYYYTNATMGNPTYPESYTAPLAVNVTLTGLTFTGSDDPDGPATSAWTWQRREVTLTATATTARIAFSPVPATSGLGQIAWDGISLVPACTIPTITTQPQNATVCAGNTATFSVAATAGSTYVWEVYFGGVWNTQGGTSPTLTIPNAPLNASGYQYRVRVIAPGGCETISGGATLTVNGTEITAQPQNATVCAGSNATFSVAATPGSTYQWQVNWGTGWNNAANGTAANLTIPSVTLANTTYQYRVIVTGSGGCQVTSNIATLTVNGTEISAQPQNATVCTGSPATFSVAATAGSTYEWQVYYGGSWHVAGSTATTLTTSNVTLANSGYQYRVIVTGSGGCQVTSNTATLTVSAPTITTHPQNVTVCAGSPATFSVAASAGSTYEWQVYYGGSWHVAGSTTTTLTTSNVILANSGYQYRVIVTGSGGCQVTSNVATLTVNGTDITSQPQNATVCAGSTATFSVAATAGSLYKWEVRYSSTGNWTDQGTTTEILTTPTLNTTNSGYQYRVIVTGSGGCQRTSNIATLTVNAPGEGGCAPLPVKLISFAGKIQEKTTLLSWKTSMETNSEVFEIERSGDGKSWSMIGAVKALGESVGEKQYDYTDREPVAGSNLYRLKMIDLDKTFAYSKIISVNADSGLETSIYPNPVSETLNLNVADWKKVKTVQIHNLKGATVYTAGASKSGTIDLKHFPDGIYILRIIQTDGSVRIHRFVHVK